MIIEGIIYIVILATAIPVGLFLSSLCEDELVKDRRYFRLMSYFLLIMALLFSVFYGKTSIVLTLVYMVFLFEVMIYRSGKIKNKKSKR